jgi:hypothetical protein
MKSKFRVIEGGPEGRTRSVFQDLEALRIRDDDDDDDLQERPSRLDEGRRKFRQLDESWVTRLLSDPHTPPWIRLAIVVLAEADFHRRIKITSAIEKAARLTRRQKRGALEHLERSGLISVEWRGRGRVPIATPLHLRRRPERE